MKYVTMVVTSKWLVICNEEVIIVILEEVREAEAEGLRNEGGGLGDCCQPGIPVKPGAQW